MSTIHYFEHTFKWVSSIFAIASVITGGRAIIDPVGFSKSFGLAVIEPVKPRASDRTRSKSTGITQDQSSLAMSYISLMGVRQLATGVTILVFAYQNKWTEIATILSLLGVLVAGTDGYFLASAGAYGSARFHYIPGGLIALLATGFLYL